MGRIKISILITLIRYGWRVRRKQWLYSFPFLPVPPKVWLLWRLESAWGIDAMNPRWSDFPTLKVMIEDIYKFGSFLKYVGGNR